MINNKHLKDGTVYCLHDARNGLCRIGMTEAGDNRMKHQVGYYPFELTVTKEYFYNNRHAEKFFHKHFSDRRQRADWFNIHPKDFLEAVKLYKNTLETRTGTKEFRVIVCYDDTLKNSSDLNKKLNTLFKNVIEKIVVMEPVENGRGTNVYSYCSQRGITYESFSPLWDNTKNFNSKLKINSYKSDLYNGSAFFERNQRLVNSADAIVILWNGVGKKFQDIYSRALAKGIKTRVSVLQQRGRIGKPQMKIVA